MNIYPSEKHESSPCPETQHKMVSSSKGVKVMVCGLDHSGSQPFNSIIIQYLFVIGTLVSQLLKLPQMYTSFPPLSQRNTMGMD